MTPPRALPPLGNGVVWPVAHEAEMLLIAGIMHDRRGFDAVADFLKPEHFADTRHGLIYATAGKVIDAGQTPSLQVLAMALRTEGALEELGGTAYLAKLYAHHMGAREAVAWGRMILDAHMRRRGLDTLLEAVTEFQRENIEQSAQERIEGVELQLSQIAEGASPDKGPVAFGSALQGAVVAAETAWKAGGKVTGVATGLIDLDKALGGLHDTDLIILAGRPGMGKTALGSTVMRNAAADELAKAQEQQGYRPRTILFFSLEMSAEQLAARELAADTGISTDRQRRGAIRLEDFQKLRDAERRLGELPIEIDDGVQTSVAALRSRARRIKRRRGLALIIVDYLQLCIGGKAENRVQEVSRITRDLKMMAKELRVPVVALSQLSRQVEARDDKRPQLSDLRESGSIEQDADVVMFVYRDEYYLAKAEPKRREGETEDHFLARRADWDAHMAQVRGIAEVIIDKNRHGPSRTVELMFDGDRTRFKNLHKERDDG